MARHVILQGKRARFYSVVDLVNQLDAESVRGAPDICPTACSTNMPSSSTNSATCPLAGRQAPPVVFDKPGMGVLIL
ncbi:MAG: hypothetical protein ACRETH_09940 [Steroidobacteraceae bacterium]